MRFSLKTLLLVVSLCAIVLGSYQLGRRSGLYEGRMDVKWFKQLAEAYNGYTRLDPYTGEITHTPPKK